MRNMDFKEQLHEYSLWRAKMAQTIDRYRQWRFRYGMKDTYSTNTILNIVNNLKSDRIMLAFVAEFSRGKTELINALFFSETGVRLLPSSPGRTTMSPTELFYDENGGTYIRLLNIESRLEDISLAEFKRNPARWTQINLDPTSPAQMQEAFKELVASKLVDREFADQLGLWNESEAAEQGIVNPEKVEIPCWRHALISFPHPLLKQGLSILDTPGLNALGTEAELTLNMLPSAQAIIFVLAADTGVTKSDLDMWRNHICFNRGESKQGLAVVMNKIDTLWDDLAGEINYDVSIRSQIKISANTLKVNEDVIFPVSAKQALLAKVKFDKVLLKKSRLDALESFLANDILKQRKKMLIRTIDRDIGFLLNESFKLTSAALEQALAQLEEFKKIDFQNQDMIKKLMDDTRNQQKAYLANVECFLSMHRIFTAQTQVLIDSFAQEKIDLIIKTTKHDIAKSLTTYGMKKNIQKLFDKLYDLLQDSVEITNETRNLVMEIHKKFKDEHGFKEIEPQLFSIKQYQLELERIFDEGEAFRSSSKTMMLQQSAVVKKLYSTLVAKSSTILSLAHADATTWGNSVLTPLIHQIKGHKKQIEGRLQILRKMKQSKGGIIEYIASLEAELEPLKRQRDELNAIINVIQRDTNGGL